MTKACEVCGREFAAAASITRFCSRPCGYKGRVVRSGGQKTGFRGTFEERLDRYTRRSDDGCWEWIGRKKSTGYGAINLPGEHREVPAHRAMYERYVGPIPAGLQLDHLCRNRACVRPDHLEPVTQRENLARGETEWARVRRTGLCKRGHPFTEENTTTYRGKRQCRICRAELDALRVRR